MVEVPDYVADFMAEHRYDIIVAVLVFAAVMVMGLAILLFFGLSLAQSFKLRPQKHPKGASVMFVLGSGGHTMELLSVVSTLNFALYPTRTWVHFSGDTLSPVRAMAVEQSKMLESVESKTSVKGKAEMVCLPRARNVGQSYITSVFTTLLCGAYCIGTVFKTRPDVVVCNGPGSCVMICFACLFLRALQIKQTRMVYIESFARVSTLSVSGKLLLRMVDRFIVQWPQLKEKYKGVEYYGILA
ncbi:oligosaccharide biosynthesis protein Alg14 like-domain-containing protein [Limtongia smithiae]|uniref:oligosaccharide biosynthesis protein Alg14 like-domain-containing protein n=1 Tax=Limtongia smithiae TaxID=1125753 RepID=UPI0034CFF523